MKYRPNSLSEHNIFSRVHELDLFKFYFLPFISLGRRYHSPYRIDTNPSFNVFRASQGSNQYLWKDHGNGETGNIFKLIILITKYKNDLDINYYQAMCKVNQDFNLGLDEHDLQIYDPLSIFAEEPKRNEVIHNERVEYELRKILYPKCVEWNKDSFNAFWNRYEHLTINRLEYYNVYPASKVYLDRNIIWEWSWSNPIYSYSAISEEWGEILYKVYRPKEKNKKFKFLNSFSSTIIEGLEQVPDKVDILILTKSRKDVIILNLLGYYAVCLPSETTKFTAQHHYILNSRSSEKYVLYDNDKAGIEAANKIVKEYPDIKPIFYPINFGKDTAEIYEKYKYNFTKQLIDKMINELQRRRD
jgi:hypothetical protein